jgi:hypothetical protein
MIGERRQLGHAQRRAGGDSGRRERRREPAATGLFEVHLQDVDVRQP